MRITRIVRFMRKYRPKPGPDDFTCEMCRGVFHRACSEKDAVAEAAERFPWMDPYDKEEAAHVCHGCFLKLGFR